MFFLSRAAQSCLVQNKLEPKDSIPGKPTWASAKSFASEVVVDMLMVEVDKKSLGFTQSYRQGVALI